MPCGHLQLLGGAADFASEAAVPSYAPDLALEPVHLDISLDLELAKRSVAASVVLTLKRNRAGVRVVELDALAFTDVVVEGVDACKVDSWRYDGAKIRITLADGSAPAAVGETGKVRVTYRVEDPVVQGLIFWRGKEDGRDRTLSVCTDHETERARAWLATVDMPACRPHLTWHITTDESHTVVASGVLTAKEILPEAEGRATWHFELKAKCASYITAFAAGELAYFEDTAGVRTHGDGQEGEGKDGASIPVGYIAPRGWSEAEVRATFGETPKMIEWAQKRFGAPFPFAKYDTIIYPECGGAMENEQLTTFDDLFLMDADGPAKAEWGWQASSVVLHELSHSWHGDSCGMRHFEHAWLKESWATYSEACWFQHDEGEDMYRWDMWTNLRAYANECKSYVRPIVTRTYDHSWRMFDRHLYPGGSWRLLMLRALCGEAPFWAGVSDYVRSFQGQLVETDMFRQKLEAHAGRNLTAFFDQWIYGKGYPVLDVKVEHSSSDGDRVTVTVTQTQEDKARGIGLFDADLPVVVYAKTDGAAHAAVVALTSSSAVAHTVLHGVAGGIARVELDPQYTVLFEAANMDLGEDVLAAGAASSPHLQCRIRAAEALIKTGTRTSLEHVRRAVFAPTEHANTHYGFRAAVATALAKAPSGLTLPLLCDILTHEEHPRARLLMVSAIQLDGLCGAALRTTLLDVYKRTGTALGPRTAAALLQAVGAHDNAADLPLLQEAANDDGHQYLKRRGALQAIGAMRSNTDAFHFLLARLRAHTTEEVPYALPALIRGLGASAAYQEPRLKHLARDEITQTGLRHRNVRVRKHAILALVELGAPEAVPAVNAIKATLAPQDHPWHAKQVAALQASGPPGGAAAALTKTVHALADRVRDLEVKLAKAEAEKKTEQ